MPDLHSELNRVLPQLIHHPPKEGNTMRNSNHPELESMGFDDEATVRRTAETTPPAPEPSPKAAPNTTLYQLYEVLKANPGASGAELLKAAKKAGLNINRHTVFANLSTYKGKELVAVTKSAEGARYTATAEHYPAKNSTYNLASRRRKAAARKRAQTMKEAAKAPLPKAKVDRPPAKKAAKKAAAPRKAAPKALTASKEVQVILDSIPVSTARRLYDALRRMFTD